MRLSLTFEQTTFLAAGTLAFAALVQCSGSDATPGIVHRDAGIEGAVDYGGSSSGAGFQGGSSGGDDVAAASDATAASADGTLADGSIQGATDSGDAGRSSASSCQRPQGGLPCDPGVVSCGGASCSTATEFCCVGGAEGGAGDVCSPFNGASCPSGALTIACDETADCTGSVCCEQIVSLGVAGPTQCMASCPAGWFQVCKSDTECGGGGDGGLNRCVRQTCTQPPGLLGGGSSVTVEACAVPATLGNLNNAGALMGCVAQ